MDNVIIMDKIDDLENKINTIQETVTLHTKAITTLLENNTNLTNSLSNLILNQHWYVTVEPSDNLITTLNAKVRNSGEIFIPVPGNYKIKTRGGGLHSTATSNVIVLSDTVKNNVHLGIGTYTTSGSSDYSSSIGFYGDLVIKNFDNTNLSKFFQ